MAPNQEEPVFDHSKVDFTKVGPRRVHMERFFRHLGLWNPDQVKVIREKSEEDACITLRNKGYHKVGQVYFEYVVDYGVWYSILGNGNASFEDHPWPVPVSAMPPRKDLSEGVSRFYRDWQRRNKSLPESQGESSKAPKSEVSTKDTATPGRTPAQPAVVSEASKKSPAVATESVAVKYDPALPFALQAKPTVATETARESSVASVAPKTVATKQPTPVISVARQASKPPADNSAGISKVAAALADITLDAAAGQSAKTEKEKEKAAAEAEVADVKEARLAEKVEDANAIFGEEVIDIEKQRSDIRHQKEAEAKAMAVANGHSPDDWPEFVEDDDDEPIIPPNAGIPVRHDFGVNDDVKCVGPMEPILEYLEDVWDELRLGAYNRGPIIGPFEIALPEWIDFHDLVYGDGGSLFDLIEDEGLIDQDIVIAWAMKNGRPISLVVGPKPTQKSDWLDRQLWLRVRATWMKVAEWAVGVYFGHPHRLTDFLRYRQDQELMGVSFMSLDDIMSLLVKRWDEISEKPEEAVLAAKGNREDLDVWIPQIHAILSQQWEYASKIAQAWVFRDGERTVVKRLKAVEYAWAFFRPDEAYRWARNVEEMIYVNND